MWDLLYSSAKRVSIMAVTFSMLSLAGAQALKLVSKTKARSVAKDA
jgi:hypothetical protein